MVVGALRWAGGGGGIALTLDNLPGLIPYCVRFQFGRSVNKAGLRAAGNTVLGVLE